MSTLHSSKLIKKAKISFTFHFYEEQSSVRIFLPENLMKKTSNNNSQVYSFLVGR